MGWINWLQIIKHVLLKMRITLGLKINYTKGLWRYKKYTAIPANPLHSLILHVQSVDKHNNRWSDDGIYISPTNNNLYDKLL